ncbi:TnsA-like heteromeric transposase endonuclease subunit [Mycobacteroides abscessus]|uniref:TnsA-like heteromeric transposase endonuclease subunit n=1 Tax=Mycobacteroides abscessus TaxID=36809 RepID=UPI0009C9599E|nr:TnsA-like heteromeric transposase endonuclease subunit [Mycobacteroides abscessus]SKG49923.1 TnsA endonuclease N terminal protein [Mycobacteroides abscessus subsp. massiliense]SKH52869.1 TnsA endonuclease N terminal protein [Mycobacteroides abscessus subsp. massiliense]SKH96374.1 TnsA endonuclease N terminal protein [Mycobacteroides abscessus subsp. massiliense]SKI92924.1 TnsA endonuclease N terminal protein [Mycobacteroides abscessus subsp. massiliense]SKJ45455.1 TnsA endonuclease N termin
MSGKDASQETRVWFRSRRDSEPNSVAWDTATAEILGDALPWRTFRWYRGQKHYSGSYWSYTQQAHVGYESRLELSRLVLADFDPAVTRIVSQPFLLQINSGKRVRRHVPDFLLLTDTGPVVVDVKPAVYLDKPKVAATLKWTGELVEGRGWSYEVWTHAPRVEFANVRFLAGYRNARWFDQVLLQRLRDADLDGRSINEAQHQLGWPAVVVRAAVFHLLWCRWLITDLDRPLAGSAVVREGR